MPDKNWKSTVVLPVTCKNTWEEEAVLMNEATLKEEMRTENLHRLRFPNLSGGDTTEKILGARHFLAKHGYKIAGVTMSFADYAYKRALSLRGSRCQIANQLQSPT